MIFAVKHPLKDSIHSFPLQDKTNLRLFFSQQDFQSEPFGTFEPVAQRLKLIHVPQRQKINKSYSPFSAIMHELVPYRSISKARYPRSTTISYLFLPTQPI